MPPDVDDQTNEEEFDDDNLGTPVVSDVAGTLEITIPDDNDNSIISDKKRKTIPVNVKEKYQLYGRMKPRLIHLRLLQNSSKRNSDILTADSNNMSPVELFEEFLTESVYDMIVEETNRYAHEVKNKLNVTKDEIKAFIGFLILSGYHTLPSERDYWTEADDLGFFFFYISITNMIKHLKYVPC